MDSGLRPQSNISPDALDTTFPSNRAAMPASGEKPEDSPFQILLVEDDLDQAHLLRFLLEDTGEYRVTLAQDGLRGSELAANGGWDLIITDLNLPGAYGEAVVKASRRTHPDTPILATTGYTGPEFADRARNEGADQVLMKPLDRDELLEVVQDLISGPVPLAAPDTGPPTLPLRVLALGIRPGEVEAGAGGTLLRHVARGDVVLVLVMGSDVSDREEEERLRNRAARAARRLDARFYMSSAPLDDRVGFQETAARVLEEALAEIRPDVLYLPTPNRLDPLAMPLVKVALRTGAEVSRVFCYDVGDGSRDFRPRLFLPVEEVMDRKMALLRTFRLPQESPLSPEEVGDRSELWAHLTGGQRAEAFEPVHGAEPWSGATESVS